MQDQTATQEQPQETKYPSSKKKAKRKWLILVFIIIIILAALIYYLFTPPEKEEPEKPETKPFETQEISTPTPIPTVEEIDRSQIEIEILNGTGIARQAAFLQGKLEELGYTEIDTGNADEQDHTTTTVSFGSEIPDGVKTEIQNQLEEVYQEVETSETDLGDYNILIIAGLREGQSLPTPTEKPSPAPTESESTPTPSPSPTPTP